jgi:glycerophosphoryl diester phosphodiesterase
MKILSRAACLLAIFVFSSCYNNRLDVLVPELPDDGSIIPDTTPLSASVKSKLEGVYEVVSGTDHFGNTVIMKIGGDRMSIFTNHNFGHVILKSGSLDSVIFFEGYWRYQSSTETGLANFRVAKDEGGRFLFGDTAGFAGPLTIRGVFGDEGSSPAQPVVLRRLRPLNPSGIAKNFTILAHHGFQTSDNMPASENSVEIIRILERFGATGIEVDVRLSKDRIPYLYHDEQLNPRLVQRTPLIGASEDYTMEQLRTFVRLIRGEQIPTVREALEAVLNDTKLSYVWLDLKTTNVQIIKEIIPIQRDILSRAAGMGRNLQIVIGLPTEEHIAEFMAIAGHDTIPSLCELSTDEVRQTNARVWGPRWTRGLLLPEVDEMHSEGRKVWSWTVSVPGFIESYLRDGRFDGMISDYPSLVNWYLYAN